MEVEFSHSYLQEARKLIIEDPKNQAQFPMYMSSLL